MFGRTRPPVAQISACRKDMAEMASAWRAVAGRSEPTARAAAEVQVFNQMVVALEGAFGPRLQEGGPGREAVPVTEVRLLALGVSAQNGWFPSDDTVNWRPELSVTGYGPGDRIRLTEALFSRLASAFLDAVAVRLSGR